MRCTGCGTESKTSKKFCAACGSPLSSRCPKCGSENAPSSAFCEDCGTALDGHAAVGRRQALFLKPHQLPIRFVSRQNSRIFRGLSEGERKTVTALFADIKGSTELMEDLDPEEARAIIDPALKLMIDAVHRYDGYVVQSTGDGIFALFGAPVAHEDHPQRALYAALRMQEELRRYSAKLSPTAATADRRPRRSQHRRGGGPLDRDRRRAIPSTRRSGIRPTSRRGCRRWRRPARSRSAKHTRKLCRRLLHPQAARPDQGQRASASRSTFTR